MGARPAPRLSTAKRRSPPNAISRLSRYFYSSSRGTYPIFIDGAGKILANVGTLLPFADALLAVLEQRAEEEFDEPAPAGLDLHGLARKGTGCKGGPIFRKGIIAFEPNSLQ